MTRSRSPSRPRPDLPPDVLAHSSWAPGRPRRSHSTDSAMHGVRISGYPRRKKIKWIISKFSRFKLKQCKISPFYSMAMAGDPVNEPRYIPCCFDNISKTIWHKDRPSNFNQHLQSQLWRSATSFTMAKSCALYSSTPIRIRLAVCIERVAISIEYYRAEWLEPKRWPQCVRRPCWDRLGRQLVVDGMIAWATPTKTTRNRAKPGGGCVGG